MKRAPLFLWVVALGFAPFSQACENEPKKARPLPSSSNTDPKSEHPELKKWRTLALAEIGGNTPIDRQLAERQAQVKTLEKKLDLWILLGRAWIQKARESSDPGFYLHAEACAQIGLLLAPDNELALNLRGLVMLNQHRFAEAKLVAEKILAKDPNDAMALGTLSDAALELGEIDRAQKAANQMMDLKPNLPSYSRISYLAWLAGDVAGAKEAIRLAFDAGRGQPDKEPATWALVQAALLFWHEGDYEGAAAGVKLALEYFPDYPPALLAQGRVLLSQGKGEPAAEVLRRSMAQHATAQTALLLADAEDAAGRAPAAQLAFLEAERLGKTGDHLSLVQLYNAHAKYTEEALRLAEAEHQKRPGLAVKDAYAFALYRAGRYPEARELCDQLLKQGTKDASLLFHAGLIHVKSGDPSGGKQLLARAQELNPGFDRLGAKELKTILASLP